MAGVPGNPNIREVGIATRFKPGQSGNPSGGSKRLSISRLVMEELAKPCHEGTSVTKAEMLASVVVSMAMSGDRAMIPLVWGYVDGQPKDSVRRSVDEMIESVAQQYNLDPVKVRERFEKVTGIAS